MCRTNIQRYLEISEDIPDHVRPSPVLPRPESLEPGLPKDFQAPFGNTLPLPGVRCPKCKENGQEVWVIPGRACGICGTPCY